MNPANLVSRTTQLASKNTKSRAAYLTHKYKTHNKTHKLMTSLSLSIQLSQCNSTATVSGNGGQFKREIVVKKSDPFLKLSRNNWHGEFSPNVKSESRENENNIFSS